MKYYQFYYYLTLLLSPLIKLSHLYSELKKKKKERNSVRDIELLLPVVNFTLYKIFICNVLYQAADLGTWPLLRSQQQFSCCAQVSFGTCTAVLFSWHRKYQI